MGTTYRYLADIDESIIVIDWFRGLSESSIESVHEDGVLFHFDKIGLLQNEHKVSPLVNIFLPKKIRGALISVGEVHFLSSPIKRFPQLADINRNFQKWLVQYHLVYSKKSIHENRYEYFLEGSIKNLDSDVYALPLCFDALKNGTYFVSHGDSDFVLDKLCKQLRLRGVEGLK